MPTRSPPAAGRLGAILAVPFGGFGIRITGDAIHELSFLPPGTPEQAPDSALAERAAAQVSAWLDDPERPFDLPLALRGSAFQQRVWHAIAAIPLGRRRTYGELATQLASAARAVGQACGANPFPLVIPCHRVVAAAGIGGFANASGGYLLDAKRWLLALETGR